MFRAITKILPMQLNVKFMVMYRDLLNPGM